ncbi:integrase, catalytic region, zinc finger, CCHC-type containing protein [Tanacetum coccineum]
MRCYNCNSEGHIAKQCTVKKRVRDSELFKDKMLLAQAQEAGVADHVDAYDSDCDDEATANAIFKANLSPVGSINEMKKIPLEMIQKPREKLLLREKKFRCWKFQYSLSEISLSLKNQNTHR